jgi:hypothetical protein
VHISINFTTFTGEDMCRIRVSPVTTYTSTVLGAMTNLYDWRREEKIRGRKLIFAGEQNNNAPFWLPLYMFI